MKRTVMFWLVSCAVLIASAWPLTVLAETQEATLTVEGRTAYINLPANLENNQRYPLVIGYHGGGGNAEGYIRHSGLFSKAEEAGFIAVCPEGSLVTRFGNHRVWNSGPEYAKATRNVDDVAFTKALIAAVSAQYPVDPRRIYATGFSNGGQMVYRLALEMSDRIAAIAPMSGARLATGERPRRRVPVLHFHGTADTLYPLQGGLGAQSRGHRLHVPVRDAIAEWVHIDGDQVAPHVSRYDGWQVEAHEGPTPVDLVLVDGMGHQIAGGKDDRLPHQALRSTPDSVKLAFEFFLAHPMP